MSPAMSSPLPGWWHRTWPLVGLGVLSVAMWIGRIRNVLGDDSLVGVGRAFRLVLAASFVLGGVAVLVACWLGWRARNWRQVVRNTAEGWRVGAGVPPWGTRLAAGLAAWTALVWSIQGVGILVDPDHDLGFKAVHTVLMVGSLVVAGTAAWGLRRTWPVAPPTRVG